MAPTNLTHIVMNNSWVVPLTETGMEIGDRHYIWGQTGVIGYEPFSYQENYIVVVYVCILLSYLSFLKGLNHTYGIWHTKYFRNIYK